MDEREHEFTRDDQDKGRRMRQTYTYSDVGLVPTYASQISSRDEVNPSTRLLGKRLSLPIVVAPMDMVVGESMCRELTRLGSIACLPRGFSPLAPDHHIRSFAPSSLNHSRIAPSCDIICVDVANGFHEDVAREIRLFRDKWPDIQIITGNVASCEGFQFLAHAGVDAVRCGIGGGHMCSTSVQTGVGVGQASLIRDLAEYRAAHKWETPYIIADGGIKNPGDVCVVGTTLILMKDLTWKMARDIREGDEIIGFDEDIQKVKESGRRRYRTGVVQANTKQNLPCRTLYTNKGEVTSSLEHMWLCKTAKGNALIWKKTKDLTAKDKIAYFGDPWMFDESREAGYIAGFFDGEGYLTVAKDSKRNKKTYTLGTSQVLGETEQFIGQLLEEHGFKEYILNRSRSNPNHQNQKAFNLLGLYNQLSFLGKFRPERLVSKAEKLWEGQCLKFLQYAEIEEIMERPLCETFSVSTSTSTFIANGFMSHNCKAIALGADVVMIGTMFGGCEESPGPVIKYNHKLYKQMAGQASFAVKRSNKYVEGDDTLVSYTGKLEKLWNKIEDGLRSSMSYMNCKTIEEFRFLPDNNFCLLSPSARIERGIHA